MSKHKIQVADKPRRQRTDFLRAQGLHRDGRASDFITRFDNLRREMKIYAVVLYCRVSGYVQDHAGNLGNQVSHLTEQMERRGIEVVDAFCEVGPGWELVDEIGRMRLVSACELAEQHGTVVVAESTCRFIRSQFFSKEHQGAWPQIGEFRKLERLTHKATLATLWNPDAKWKTIRGLQTKRGQQQKGSQVGRPRKRQPGYKKRLRERYLETVLELREKGRSLGQIAEVIGVPRSTVQYWVGTYS